MSEESVELVRRWYASIPDLRDAESRDDHALLDHAFHGASELVRIETSDAQVLIVRTSQRGVLRGEVELEFSPDDPVPVRESGK